MLMLEHCFISVLISFFYKVSFFEIVKNMRRKTRFSAWDWVKKISFIKAECRLLEHFRILKTADTRETESIQLLVYFHWSLPDTQKRLRTKQGDRKGLETQVSKTCQCSRFEQRYSEKPIHLSASGSFMNTKWWLTAFVGHAQNPLIPQMLLWSEANVICL